MNSYVRLSATYGREEINRLIQAARDVLGDEADTSYTVVMSSWEVANMHPTDTHNSVYRFLGGFSSIVRLPKYSDDLHGEKYFAFIEASQQVRTEVMEELHRWKAGDAGEFGELSPNDDQVITVRKRADGRFNVRFESSESQNWERDRAERRIPFPGCRQMIWDRAGMGDFEVDHEAVDWAISFTRDGR